MYRQCLADSRHERSPPQGTAVDLPVGWASLARVLLMDTFIHMRSRAGETLPSGPVITHVLTHCSGLFVPSEFICWNPSPHVMGGD